MRVTAARRGNPDRSRAGNFRGGGGAATAERTNPNPRVGYPDRTNVGPARRVDRRRETRNLLRDQHGYDFLDRILIACGDNDARSTVPTCGDIRINTEVPTDHVFEFYNAGTSIAAWNGFYTIDEIDAAFAAAAVVYATLVQLASVTSTPGASLIGVYDTAPSYFTATTVEGVLAEIGANYVTATILTTHKTSTDHDGQYFTETELGLVTTPGGASLIGVWDSAGHFSTANVESVLAELAVDLAAIPAPIVSLEELDDFNTTTPLDGQVLRYEQSATEWQNSTTVLITDANLLDITGTVDIAHTAAENDDHAFEIDVIAGGFGDVKAIDVDYITGAIAAGEDVSVILLNIDNTSATGGDVNGLEMLLTDFGIIDAAHALFAGVGIGPVEQLSGTFANPASLLDNAVDVLAALSSGGAGNVSVFEADNETMTFGLATTFQEIEFLVDTAASGAGIAPTWEYSTGIGTWAAFSPVDGTNGLRNTGVVAWLDSDISWATGTGTEYLIRMTRTRNSLSTTPILDEVQVSDATEYYWNKDGDILANDGVFDKMALGQAAVDANSILRVEGAHYGAGAATTSADVVSLEDLTQANINIVSPIGALVFSDGTRDVFNITANHSLGSMTLKSDSVTMMGVTSAGVIAEVGVSKNPQSGYVHHAVGASLCENGYSTSTVRNGRFDVWTDSAFGIALGGTNGPALHVYGREGDTVAIQFGTYPASSTSQADFTELGAIYPTGRMTVGKGGTSAAAQLHVHQNSTTAAISTLELQQDDTDQEFIEFDGTSSTGGAASLDSSAGEAGACSGKIRITVNGTTRWLRFYADET